MRHRYCFFGVVVPVLMLASVACAAAVPPASPGSSTAARPTDSLAATAAAASPALPQADDLTLRHAAGKVLVGLTVRPAQPGPNTLLVYVLPLDGPAAAADVPLSLAVGGQTVLLDTCSRTCRTANVTLTGGGHIDLVARGASGGHPAFDPPPKPPPGRTALRPQIHDPPHQHPTYPGDETLRPPTP